MCMEVCVSRICGYAWLL